MSLRASRSNLTKYKKEITWLLKEKYHYSEVVILDFFQDLYFSNSTLKKEMDHHASLAMTSLQGVKRRSHLISQQIDINMDIERILNGEPVDYVIGFKDFLNCKIDLSLKPLIPRPETEFWVESVINNSSLKFKNSKILDLCCGSGCIGIALLKNLPNSSVTFVDISGDVLKQTEINCQLNLFSCHPELVSGSKIQILKSDLFSNLKGQKFDYIFTNPPYVKQKDIKDSLLFEPELALNGYGNDGLNIIYKILEEFPKFLNPSGMLFLEFGFGQKLKIEKKILDLGFKNYEFKKDQFGKYRVLIISI